MIEFFDQNPISQVSDHTQALPWLHNWLNVVQVGLILTRDGRAEKLQDLNGQSSYVDAVRTQVITRVCDNWWWFLRCQATLVFYWIV